MKWCVALGCIFLFAISIASAVIPDDCDSSMGGYWKLDGNSYDSINGYNGNSFPGDWVLVVDGAAEFNGGNAIVVNDIYFLDLTGTSTVHLWFEESSTPQNGTLIDKEGAYEITYEYYPAPNLFSDPFSRIVTTYGGIAVGSVDMPLDGEAHMVSVTHNVTHLRLYIDGKLGKEVAHGFRLHPSGTALQFGNGFKGAMDEIAIYNRSLAANEVLADYNKASSSRDYCYRSGAGGTAGTRTDFTINGCNITGFGGLSIGSCSRNGRYYCQDKTTWFDTVNEMGGCLAGEAPMPDDPCCPRTYKCSDKDADDTPYADPSGYKCTQRTENCFSYTDIDECKTNQCFWLIDKNGVGVCTESPSDYSCNFYTEQKDCLDDVWNLGRTGTGTEICGTYVSEGIMEVGYDIPMDYCKCAWDDTLSNSGTGNCYFSYDVVPDIHGGDPDQFTCLKNFTLGNCDDGFQAINWTVDFSNVQGVSFSVYQTTGILPAQMEAVAKAANCEEGGDFRSCGDPIIKLYFFSSYSFIAVVLIISLFYCFKHFKWK